MARKKKELINESKRLENKDVLSIQQLIQPHIGTNDHNRLQMVSSQLTQALWLTEVEPPLVQSIYNKEMVKYSNMIITAKEDMENLGKIKLQNEEFLLLKNENELELYRIDTPILASAFTARHTYVNEDNKIKKDKPIIIKGNSDLNGNLQIGINAFVGYMVYGDNFEDSAIISESFAKKITHVEKDVISFVINANEYLLNIYGDENTYKCLPDIGSYIDSKSRIVCAKRAVNKGWNSYIALSKNVNRKINFFGDDIYYSKGKVTDISIYSNLDEIIDLEKTDFYKSIEVYLNKNQEDVKHFLHIVDKHIKKYKDKNIDFKFGPNLQYYYNKFRKIDKNNILTLNDKKFNGLLVKVTIEREVPGEVGCKICNMHGGKNIVTMVLPDDKMPKRVIDGKPFDVILSPNSVIGRLNPGQIHETTINRIAEEVRKEMLSNSNDKAKEIYLDFMKDLLPERLHNQLKCIEKLKDKKLDEFINSIKEDEFILIPQVPFEHMTLEKMSKWYNKYNLNNDIVSINGHDVLNPVLTGMQYILKLKHLPEKKMSACNSKKFGSKTLQPAKDKSLKSYKIAIGSNPNTIGEQETSILLALSKKTSILKELIFLKSSDIKNRESMLEKLFSNDEISIEEFDNLESIAVKNLEYYLNVIGITLKK